MPCAAAPSHVVAAVADHQHPLGQRLQLCQGVGQHLDLGLARAVGARAGDDLEMLVEPEMGEDAPRRRLQLGGGDGQPDTGGAQIRQQRLDPVEQRCSSPSPGRRTRRGRRRSPSSASLAELHGPEGVVHRRADDLGGQVALGHRGADVAERVQEAGDDPLARSRSACRRDRRSPAAPHRGRWRRRGPGNRLALCLSPHHCPRWAWPGVTVLPMHPRAARPAH